MLTLAAGVAGISSRMRGYGFSRVDDATVTVTVEPNDITLWKSGFGNRYHTGCRDFPAVF